ncbi:MAG: PocR ligand-binding domain-containing protein [Candidatus Omnitrophica bacterium]|nr:PocR ligand-binding domain-containing protein [Candidatus Omnitrophota bacterium]
MNMSIKLKLTVIFMAFALIPLALISTLTFRKYENSLKDGHISALRDIAFFKADKIETYCASLKANILIAQGFYNIKRNLPILNRLADKRDDPEFRAAWKILDSQLSVMQAALGLADIILVNPEGRIVYSRGVDDSSVFLNALPDPGQKSFVEGKNGIYITDIFFNKTHKNKFSILVSAPAVDLNDIFIGVIAFEMDMDRFYDLARDVPGLGKTGEILLGKKIGNEVLYLNPQRHDPGLSRNNRITIGQETGIPIQEAVQGRTGVGLSIDYRRQKVIAAWRYIPSLDLGIVTKIDAWEAFSDAENMRKLVLLILFVVLVLVYVTAFLSSKSIARPINKLIKGTQIVGGGNLDYKIANGEDDEIGQLSRAFDKMTTDLQKTTASRDELDKQINARKQLEEALRESEQRVRAKLKKILSPEGSIDHLQLGDIVDVTAIQMLLDDFNRFYHVPMAMIDLEGKVLVGVGWQEICTKFHRAHPKTCEHCIESDTQLSSNAGEGKFELYKCKNGLWDVATPIIIGGKKFGNLFMGQFFFNEEDLDYEFFKAQARLYGFNEKEYMTALGAVPRISREYMEQVMSFFLRVSHMLSQLSYSNIKLARLLTERDILTNSLRESQEDLKRAQTVGNIGNWRLNIQGNELVWSEENYRIFGVPKGTSLTYEIFLSIVHPEDRNHLDKKWKAAMAGEKYDIEHRIIVDGKVKWVREKAYLEFDKKGVLLSGFGTTQDITSLKKAEEILKRDKESLEKLVDEKAQGLIDAQNEIDRAKRLSDIGTLAATVAHELRNPLADIGLSTYHIKKMIKDPRIEGDLSTIDKRISEADQIIKNVLSYSKVKIGRFQIVKINSILKECIDEGMGRFSGQNINVNAKIDLTKELTIDADPLQLKEVFSNILSNAFEALNKNSGIIDIESRVNDSGVSVSIKDNGEGIENEHLKKVFEPFFTTKTKGTGLGLAVCNLVIKLHGGTITVESDKGKGTKVTIGLPILRQKDA